MDEQKLYLMKNSFGLIKIGISKDPETRANTLRLASGVAIDVLEIYECKDAYELEQYLHTVFKESRLEGEWFKDVSAEDIVKEGKKYTKMVEWCGEVEKTQQKEHTLSQTYLPDGYLSLSSAARMIPCSRKTLYKHIKQGKVVKDYYHGNPCVSVKELERVYGVTCPVDINVNPDQQELQEDKVLFKLRRENAILKDRIKIIQDLLVNIDTDSGL